jgi:hypothetical protein
MVQQPYKEEEQREEKNYLLETDDEGYFYLKRLNEQIKYHSDKSKENKKKFHRYQIIIILTGALVPVVNAINNNQLDPYLRIVSSILGGIIVVVTAILQMYKHQENWILYRTTQELLKREKALYLNDAGDYFGLSTEQKKRQLVERVEALITSETSKYFAFHKSDQQVRSSASTTITDNSS